MAMEFPSILRIEFFRQSLQRKYAAVFSIGICKVVVEKNVRKDLKEQRNEAVEAELWAEFAVAAVEYTCNAVS